MTPGPAPVTGVADRGRPRPAAAADRRAAIDAALASLRAEERRLERLGLGPALARCRAERRYWQFLSAVHPDPERAPSGPGFRAPTWPARAAR